MPKKDKLYLGIDLGGTSIRAAVVTATGEVVGFEKRKTRPELGAPAVTERVAEAARRAIKSAGLKKSSIARVGVGVPGPVDAAKGVVRVAVNLGPDWAGYPLAETLGEMLKLPVLINNDVRVGALGEHTHGAGQGLDDMIAVFIGTGIGGGLILGGKLRGGFRGGAGEVGHTFTDVLSEPARDIEALASRTGMERHILAQVAAGRESVVPQCMKEIGRGRLTSRAIVAALEQNDALMAETLAQAQRYLGLLTASLVNIIDPQMVVFGGGVTERLGEAFVGPIRQVAQAHYINKDPLGTVQIVPAALKDLSGAVGAAVLARRGD